MAKPHLFADVPEDGLTLETQLYTQRLEDVAVPQDYKFRLGDLTDMLVSEGLLGLWESDGANALMQVSDNDNILIGNGSGSSLTGTRNILLGFETGALIDSDFSVGIGSRSLRESVAFQPTAIGANAGEFSAGLSPLFIGDRAGRYSTSDYPVAIGWRAGYNGSGGGNIAIGTRALEGTNSTSGENNIAIGSSSQFAVVGGSNNIGIGSVTLINNVFGSANTAIGRGALRYVTTSDNVAIGYRAGQGSGGGGVFLGAEAGKDETGSNKLYIANSSTTTPLIHGVFPNDFIRVNGKFEVSDKTGIATTFAGWQGDQIVDSGVSTDLSSYDQDLTLSGSTIGITGGSSFNLSSINYWSENASDDLFFLGNVGVNTGNPSEALHVVGTMRMQGFFRDSNNSLGTNGQFLGRDNFGVVWQTPSLQNLTWNSTSNTIGITGGSSFNLSSINYWSENASDDLFFLGNVGVNTGNPSEALHVVGTMRMQGFFRDSNNSLGTNGQFLGRDNFGVVWQTPSLQNLTWNSTSNIIGITGGSSFNLSSINYWSENASDDLFFLGNVGVNTGNPSEALHVVGTMRMQGFFRDSNNSLGTNGQFLGRDNFGVVWQTPSLQNLTWNSTSNIIGITGGSSFNLSSINYWSENASDDLFFLGNVGVNTGNPSEALHVVGTMRMQGFFRDSNNSLGTNGQFSR